MKRFFSRLKTFLFRISFRLLAFNILLVILPWAGFLFLDTYEKQLLASQEDSMVQQGRLLSAALAEQGPLDEAKATTLLTRLRGRTVARLRVVDREGRLLADSSVLPVGGDREEESSPASARGGENTRAEDRAESRASDTIEPAGDWLYGLFTGIARLFREVTGMPKPDLASADFYSKDKPLMGPEIKAALDGRYGATTRYSIGEQRQSIIIYSAIPVRSAEKVVGVVLVSQSTYRLLLDLYEVRMGTLKVFLFCMVFAVVLSLFLSSTIGRPLRRLRDEAEAVLDKRGRLLRPFRPTRRLDEIGDLGRTLRALTERLETHMQFIESFAADLSHEFKNPLASIRSAAEIALEAGEKKERAKFLDMAIRDVARMERLLSGAREISRLDVGLAMEPREEVRLDPLVEHIVAGAALREKSLDFRYRPPEKPVSVAGREERLAQVLENVLDNACGFSPEGGRIDVVLSAADGHAVITVADEGPGIPEEHREKIFGRFFTFRPGAGDNTLHTGLGLSVVKVIVQGYDGTVAARNRESGGAAFEIRLPLFAE
ncbi:MAG: HAMP domain-containing protein [Spirochaetales bacterium]|nr:HAMP domain-containing protein [Spirochaetales bacterium]